MPTEAELLGAIYEQPYDVGARSVYGDWLAERGDPKGELIALQLGRRAAAASAAARRRERELIRAYHEAWVGTLGYWFEPIGRVFEDGLFAGGVLRRIGEPADLDRMLRDPMWRLVRVIELTEAHSDALARGLIERPELVSLRAVYGLGEEAAAALAEGRERALTAFGWRTRDLGRMAEALATMPALPALRELAPVVPHATTALEWFADAPVIERVERIRLRTIGALTRVLEVLAARCGALREVALLPWNGPARAEDGWRIELSRSVAPGAFTRVAASHQVSATQSTAAWFASELAVLSRVPAEGVREIVIEAERMPLLAAHDRARLVAVTERFANATKQVPWEREPGAAVEALVVHARLEGSGLLEPATLQKLWPILIHQLGQRYTTLRTNGNATERPLGKKPLDRILGWAGKPATTRLVLARDGRESSVDLQRGSGVINTLVLEVHDRSIEEVTAAFARIVELGAFRRGRCGVGFIDAHAADFAIPGYDKVPEAGWLLVFGPELAAVLPAEQVAKLAAHPLLGGLFVVPAERHLIVALARSATEISPERLRAAARGLHAIMTPHTIRRLGYDIRERAVELLAGAAAIAGLEAVTDPERPLSQRFVHRKQPACRLHVVVERALEAPMLYAALEVVHDERITARRFLTGEPRVPIAHRAALDGLLANVARRVIAEAAAWFAANA